MTSRSDLDALLPRYHVQTLHTIDIPASAAAAYSAFRSVDLSRSRVIRILFRLRGLPRRAAGPGGLEQLPFVTLRDIPNACIVLGAIGKFWRATGRLEEFPADQFRSLDPPRSVKALWSFHVDPLSQGGVRVTTETRVFCTDRRSRIAFTCYWTLISPFSSWIRREILRLLAVQATNV